MREQTSYKAHPPTETQLLHKNYLKRKKKATRGKSYLTEAQTSSSSELFITSFICK